MRRLLFVAFCLSGCTLPVETQPDEIDATTPGQPERVCELIPTTGKCLVVTGRFTACRNTFGSCVELGGGVKYSCLSSAMPLHAEGQYEVREVAKVGGDCAACRSGNAYVMAVKFAE